MIIDDDACSDAGADGDINHMMMPLPGAKFPFSQGSQVGIVAQYYRSVEMFIQIAAQGNVLPSWDIGSFEDNASIGINRPGSGNADGCYFVTGRPN